MQPPTLRRTILAAAFLMLLPFATAADPEITTDISLEKAAIGDAVQLTVRIYHDGDWTFDRTLPEEKLGEAHILSAEWRDIPPAPDNPQHQVQLDLSLAFYDTGEMIIPELALTGSRGGAAEPQTFYTPEQMVVVEGVLADENDQQMADDRENLDKKVSPLLMILAILVVVAVLAVAGYLFHRWRQPKPVVVKAEPALPPFDEAMQSLETVTSGSLLKEGRVKEFYVEINRIIRHYYSRLYGINAEEMTSFELEQWFEDHPEISAELIGLNRVFQELCDSVKFAKYEPVESENQENVNRAYQIVQHLKPRSEETPAPKQEDDHVAVG
ncbi:hypothetical protein APED_21635 [Acanthopleuribacter pedis]